VEDIAIVGEFTKWKPKKMEPSSELSSTYAAKVNLSRGYKHRYQILVNGIPTIDATQKFSKNEVTGNLTNFIIIPHVEFDSPS